MGALVAIIVVAAAVVFGIIYLQKAGQKAPAPALPPSTTLELGPATAPVVVEEFFDFQCPACQMAEQTTVHKLQADVLAPGAKFKLVFRNFPFIGAESQRLAEASVCAAGQNKFAPFMEQAFAQQKPENSGYWTSDRILQFATGLGLDPKAFTACLDSGLAKPMVANDYNKGKSYKVQGTPAFVINGKLLTVPFVYENVKKAIDDAIVAAGAK